MGRSNFSSWACDADLTVEPIGIGKKHRALGAVDLEDAVSEQRCVEAEQALRRSTLLELGEDRDVREHLDWKFSARTIWSDAKEQAALPGQDQQATAPILGRR